MGLFFRKIFIPLVFISTSFRGVCACVCQEITLWSTSRRKSNVYQFVDLDMLCVSKKDYHGR